MRKYIITTESGSDLSQEIIDRYNIEVVPMHVTMEDQTYPDGSFDVQKILIIMKKQEIYLKHLVLHLKIITRFSNEFLPNIQMHI